ncbi:hypothetical protein JHK82_029400 [Glycine max]|uniref:Uncharacterized protein n=2 Tax=Glycine subgen. Soja TaxID=1462606 RepID=K7LLT4_SOYBN|nr:hypothetical protein JHK87_029319 [Glycine soja]KAG4998607.1 hypothetical protein JHK85_030046 [Glycine max]KAG5005376.1 hypothetical protein JHK86_029515 [Glycine max]KAG5128565.1 hypothetical protein JHK82_029400 [Glycine max]KAG5153171.1 hypothetical protein JHK84_029643 [Glycine max]
MNATYIFYRKDLSRPTIQLPCASKAVVAVRFCPIFFKLRGKNLGICVLSILIFYEELLYIMATNFALFGEPLL